MLGKSRGSPSPFVRQPNEADSSQRPATASAIDADAAGVITASSARSIDLVLLRSVEHDVVTMEKVGSGLSSIKRSLRQCRQQSSCRPQGRGGQSSRRTSHCTAESSCNERCEAASTENTRHPCLAHQLFARVCQYIGHLTRDIDIRTQLIAQSVRMLEPHAQAGSPSCECRALGPDTDQIPHADCGDVWYRRACQLVDAQLANRVRRTEEQHTSEQRRGAQQVVSATEHADIAKG